MSEQKKWFHSDIIKLEYILPAVHFLLTFLLERICFIFSGNMEFRNELVKNEYISDTAELVLVYVLSKICAGIIIWLLWRLVFAVIRRRIPLSICIIFGVIYIMGAVIGLFFYPNNFALGIDNFTTYSMAIRFLPTYWQSIYTGVVYAGSMMLIPHPIGIFLFQWLAFVAVVAYIYCGMDKVFPGRNVKYLSLILLFLPEAYDIMFDAYRNNYYAILCLFYFAYLFFNMRAKDKTFRMGEMVALMLVSAFIMVWRSEGILIGAGGILLLLWIYKVCWKKALPLVGVFLASFLLMNHIQGIGSEKYYGRDYMIVNTAEVLRSIFNAPGADLSYEGAEADLAAIGAVVPVQVLKEGGLEGFRNYNWTIGHVNFNQTMSDDVTADNYMSAYYHIILNNMPDYLNVQLNNFFSTLQINVRRNTYTYTGESRLDLEPFDYYRWRLGSDEIRSTFLTTEWENDLNRIWVCEILLWVMAAWRDLWTGTGINVLLHAGVLLADVFILLFEVIKFITGRDRKCLEYITYFLIILGEFAAIFFFMPVSRAAYLYPVLYGSYLLILFYLSENRKDESQMISTGSGSSKPAQE